MPKTRKRNSLLALAFKRPKKRQYYHSYSIHGGYWQQRITLANGQQAYFRQYDDGHLATIPILPITLKMLGFQRLPSGRIIPIKS